ncbi:TolC family protein [Ruegeria lacuscaerulensis]|uniref:TolC family protein n=1 Tax=Ruegeria lacuscaerulensis TaxID=55218 RepID=UPI00147F011E|nr:TolC family protein [Ruegeria lacuscaerulensis]
MPIFDLTLRAVPLFFLVALSSACAPAPDLTKVEASFSKGSVGAGASLPSLQLAQSGFGQRVRAAVETSPELAQSASRLVVASANEDVAKGAFLPQFSVGLNARSERIASDLADVSPYLRISQLVYDGGAASGNLVAAQARVLESRGDRLQTAAATALSAIEAYVVVLDRRKLLDISTQNVAAHEELVLQTTERSAKGAGSNADVQAARSRMADARTRFADAKARLDRAEAQFREVFGVPSGDLPPPVEAPNLSRTDMQIITDSPQVRRANAALLAAKAERTAALARRQPDVRVAAFADRDDSNDANFGVDLAFNYELDTTGQRRASIAAAEARVKEAEFERESVIRIIRRELGFVRSDQQAGAERLQAARSAVQANADSVAAARAQFTIGRRSLIEILDAQRDFVNAQERLILAEQSFFLTNYAALSLTGDILDLLGISTVEWSNGR